MAVQHSLESEYAKEMVKWEAFSTVLGQGLRPYVKREYPWTYYRADRVEGAAKIVETVDAESDVKAANLQSRGFYPDPEAALKGLKAQELDMAKAAANRAFHEQRMSPQAQAEAAAADDAHSGHLPSVPETPIVKRRGRPPKMAA